MDPKCPFKTAEIVFNAAVVGVANCSAGTFGMNEAVDYLQLNFFQRFFKLEASTPINTLHHIRGYYAT